MVYPGTRVAVFAASMYPSDGAHAQFGSGLVSATMAALAVAVVSFLF